MNRILILMTLAGLSAPGAAQHGPIFPAARYAIGAMPVDVVGADLDDDGALDLAAVNKQDGTVSVIMGAGNGTFTPGVVRTVGSGPEGIEAVDLDQDGLTDLVVANSDSADLSILLGMGDGNLQPAISVPVGLKPHAVAAADLNGDGITDLAVGLAGGVVPLKAGVDVLLGTGGGSFSPAVFAVETGRLRALAAGDLDADGVVDLAVATINPGAFGISPPGGLVLLHGVGDGTFTQLGATIMPGVAQHDVAIADVNADGVPDILSAVKGADAAAVVLGTGGGSFDPPLLVTVSSKPDTITTADFDGDGALDLALVHEPGPGIQGSISLLLGAGDGTFGAQASYDSGAGPVALVAHDLDRDGHADLVIVNRDDDDLTVLTAKPDGTLLVPQAVVPLGAKVLLAKDLDGDGFTDLVGALDDTAEGEAWMARGRGDGTFEMAATIPITFPALVTDLDAADLDRDGDQDVLITTRFSDCCCCTVSSIQVLLNDGDGSFTGLQLPGDGHQLIRTVVTDFNEDGVPDLLIGYVDSQGLYSIDFDGFEIRLGKGDGSFVPVTDLPLNGSALSNIDATDVTGDDRPDVIVLQSSGIQVYVGLGDGSVTPLPRILVPGPGGMVVADINADKHAEIVSAAGPAGFLPGFITVWEQDLQGGFMQLSSIRLQQSMGPFGVSDVDADGMVDVLAFGSDGVISVLRGLGDGALAAPLRFDPAHDPQAPLFADLNGDGLDDLITVDLFDYAAPAQVTVALNSLGPWSDLGFGLAGSAAKAPHLAGSGMLLAGQTVGLSLSGATPFSTATLVIGASSLTAAFKGGVLVPSADASLAGLPTGPAGTGVLQAVWPAGLPPRTTTFFQAWIVDPSGPQGFSASNAVSGTTP